MASGVAGGSPSKQDKTTFTEGTDNVVPVGGVRNDTPVGDVSEDQASALRITPKRGVHANLRDNSGVEIGTSGNPVRVDTTGTTVQPVKAVASVDANNSTTSVLSGNAVFTGSATQMVAYAGVCINCFANVSGTLSIQWSTNGTDWDIVENAAITGGTAESFNINTHAEYFRIVYTNGGSAQTTFRLETILFPMNSGVHSSLVATGVTDNQSALTAKSVIHGRTTAGGGSYVPVKVNPSGALTADVSGTVTANAGSGTFAVSAASLPLPSNAATSAKQDTMITSLANIDAGIPAALGAALTSASMPVTIASDQTVPVSGTVTANAGSGTFAVSGPLTDTQLRATAVPVSGTFWQTTQPVSGTVTANAGSGTFAVSAASLPLPSGAATSANQTNGSQIAKIGDGSNTVSLSQDIDGEYHLQSSVIQDISVIAANSSTSNLNAGATFTGTSTATSGHGVINVHLHADQNCTVYVDQSSDGTNWDATDSYAFNATTLTGQGRSVKCVSSYFRVRVTNNGSSSTTYFRLNTTLEPIGSVLPRTLTTAGNLKVSAQEGEVGITNADVMSRLRMAAPEMHIDVEFFRGTPAELLTVTTANGGATAASNGAATFTSGTSANSQAKGVTQNYVSYRAGDEVFVEFSAAFTTGVASTYQRIGLYDTNNGVFIGYEGSSFGVTRRTGASDTTVAKASFNGDTLTGAANSKFTRLGTPEAIDLTKLNLYRIRFSWYGAAHIMYEVMSPDGKWVTFHTINYPNTATTPSMRTPELPITCDVSSTPSNSSVVITTNCWGAGVSGLREAGIIDAGNSRVAATLASATTWTGKWTACSQFGQIKTFLYASNSVTAGTLYCDFSMDGGTTTHRTVSISVTDANSESPHAFSPIAGHFRIRYTTGGTSHSNFTVQTILTELPYPIQQRVGTAMTDASDAHFVKAALTGYTGSAYAAMRVSSGGYAETYPTPSGATGQALTNSSSTALETNRVAKNAAGTLYGFTVTNTKSSGQYIQLHNTTSNPADTAVPVCIWYVNAGATLTVDFGIYGRRNSTGITLCNSSTAATKTIGSADCYFDVQYV